jgi:hypothetical protein
MKSLEERSGKSGVAWQMWHQNGTRCPKGTVPIRRSTVHDVLRAKSLYEYGKKQRRSPLLFRRNEPPEVVNNGEGHEVCIIINHLSKLFHCFENSYCYLCSNFFLRQWSLFLVFE